MSQMQNSGRKFHKKTRRDRLDRALGLAMLPASACTVHSTLVFVTAVVASDVKLGQSPAADFR